MQAEFHALVVAAGREAAPGLRRPGLIRLAAELSHARDGGLDVRDAEIHDDVCRLVVIVEAAANVRRLDPGVLAVSRRERPAEEPTVERLGAGGVGDAQLEMRWLTRHLQASLRTTGTGRASSVGSGGLKLLVLALAATVALALAACGGDDDSATSTGPVTLEQRVVSEEDAPGSESDPVETPVKVSSKDEFASKLGDRFVNPPPEDIQTLRSSSFVSAYDATRFFPDEEGDPHSRTVPHVSSLVMQFGTADDAKTAADLLHADSVRPCPETCAEQAEEFEVDGIPDAYGTHRFATAESIQGSGDTEANPFDGFEIGFADGVFAYRVIFDGPPGTVSEEEAVEIAQHLYDRVHGAPAP
jgi:hypothetical protein